MAKVVKNKTFLEIIKDDGAIAGWLCLFMSIALLSVSFFLPPKGVIDPSVLQGVGEIFAFNFVFQLPKIIRSVKDGKSITLKKGEFEIGVQSEKKEDEEEK